jgi:hypothetical protein
METTSKSVEGILVLFNKSLSHNTAESDVLEIIKNWIRLLNRVDPAVRITFNTIEGENRLWFLFENDKISILSQLEQMSTAGAVQALPVTETNQAHNEVQEEQEMSVTAVQLQPEESTALQRAYTDIENIVTEPLIKEPDLPVVEPESIKFSDIVALPQKEITDIEKTAVMNNLFAQSRDFAASAFHDQQSFQDRLCNAIEKGFSNLSIQSAMHNEAIMERLNVVVTDIKQDIVDSETRVNRKLVAIYKVTAVCANKTEAISAMFDSFKSTSNHSPAYTDKI